MKGVYIRYKKLGYIDLINCIFEMLGVCFLFKKDDLIKNSSDTYFFLNVLWGETYKI